MEMCDYDIVDIIKNINLLNLSIEINTNDALLYLERGKLYSKIFNYNLAIKDFEKAMTSDNCNIIDTYFNLALAYINKNSVFGYIKSIGEVISLDDEDTKAHADYMFGDIKNLEKAKSYLIVLLKIDPKNANANQEMKLIDEKLKKIF